MMIALGTTYNSKNIKKRQMKHSVINLAILIKLSPEMIDFFEFLITYLLLDGASLPAAVAMSPRTEDDDEDDEDLLLSLRSCR